VTSLRLWWCLLLVTPSAGVAVLLLGGPGELAAALFALTIVVLVLPPRLEVG
jgi:hypothetical protein